MCSLPSKNINLVSKTEDFIFGPNQCAGAWSWILHSLFLTVNLMLSSIVKVAVDFSEVESILGLLK